MGKDRITVNWKSIKYLFNVEECKFESLDDGMGRHYSTVCTSYCKIEIQEPRIIPDKSYKL